MSVTAAIKFTQGLTVGAPGQSLFGVLGTLVTVANNDNTGPVVRWKFEILDVPPGSAVPVGVVQDGGTSTYSFTPDVTGGYLFRLTVYTAGDAEMSFDEHTFGVKELSGRFVPPFTPMTSMGAEVLNFGGNTRGWAPYMEQWLAAIAMLSLTWAGDLAGSTNTTQVVSGLTGDLSSIVTVSAGNLAFVEDLVSNGGPDIYQNDRTSDAPTTYMSFVAQAPYSAATGSNRDGAGFAFYCTAPRTGGAHPTFTVTLDNGGAFATDYAVGLEQGPSGVSTGASVATSGHFISFLVNSGIKASFVSDGLMWFPAGASGPNIYQFATTTASATGQTFTIHAQNATGTTSIGGALDLRSGTGTSSSGAILFHAGSTQVGSLAAASGDYLALSAAPSTTGMLRMGSGVGTGIYMSSSATDFRVVEMDPFGSMRFGGNTATTEVYGGSLAFGTTGLIARMRVEPSGVAMGAVASVVGSYGGGVDVISVLNATTVPTTNPVNGFVFYSTAGAMAIRPSTGNVSTFGANVTLAADDSGDTSTFIVGDAGAGVDVFRALFDSALVLHLTNNTSLPRLYFGENVGSPSIGIDDKTGDAVTDTLYLRGQVPFAGATGDNRYVGNVEVVIPAPGTASFGGHFGVTTTSEGFAFFSTDHVDFQTSAGVKLFHFDLTSSTNPVLQVEEAKTFLLYMTPRASDAATTLLQIYGSDAFSGATGGNVNGGDVQVTGGAGKTSATPGHVYLGFNGGGFTGQEFAFWKDGITLAKGLVTPHIAQADNTTNSATATSLTLQAQNATGTSATGGDVILKSGTGTSQRGSVRISAIGAGDWRFWDGGIGWSQVDIASALVMNVTNQITIQSGAGLTTAFGDGSQNNLELTNTSGAVRHGISTLATSLLYAQNDRTGASATGAVTTIRAQNATGTTSVGGNLEIGPGTGTSSNGFLNFINPTTTTSATSAGPGTVPLVCRGFMTIEVAGTAQKIAYYDP